MVKYFTLILTFLLTIQCHSNQVPEQLNFHENDRIKIDLSPFSYNKVYVKGEEITDVYFVEGEFNYFQDDYIEDKKTKDDGAIYIVPLTMTSPIIYLTTNKGHHFSLQVMAKGEEGKTISFNYRYPKRRAVKKQTQRHATEAETLLKQIVSGHLPNGFTGGSVRDRGFSFDNAIHMKLVKFYKGDSYKAYVYQATNKSKKPVKVNPEQFSDKETKAIVVSESQLKPKQSMYVYTIIEGSKHA